MQGSRSEPLLHVTEPQKHSSAYLPNPKQSSAEMWSAGAAPSINNATAPSINNAAQASSSTPQHVLVGSDYAPSTLLFYPPAQPPQPWVGAMAPLQADTVTLIPVVDVSGREIGYMPVQDSAMAFHPAVPIKEAQDHWAATERPAFVTERGTPSAMVTEAPISARHSQHPSFHPPPQKPLSPRQPPSPHARPSQATAASSLLPPLLPDREKKDVKVIGRTVTPRPHGRSHKPSQSPDTIQTKRRRISRQQLEAAAAARAPLPAEAAVICKGVPGVFYLASFEILCKCTECMAKGSPELCQFSLPNWEIHCGE